MSVNKHQPHLMVLPEDDANHQLATGFNSQVGPIRQRQMQVLPVAAGWPNVLSLFQSEHVKYMDRFPNRFMVLLMDFDRKQERLGKAKAVIPDRLTDRVFVLGVWSEPEDLKPDLGSPETVGSKLADDCHQGNYATWEHNLLRHNANELDRLRTQVRSILFA